MVSITSSGLGSGMDINGLVTKLVEAEKAPAVTRLDKAEAKIQARISAYGSFKSALSAVRDSLAVLGKAQTFQKVSATSSDSTVLTASAGVNADAGKYRMEVQRLAQNHALSSKSYDSASAVVGSGTLTIKFGTTQYDAGTDTYEGFTQNPDKGTLTLTIDDSNNTLTGIRDAINKSAAGVTASIVYNGSGHQLVLNSTDSGAKNSLQIAVTDTSDGNNTDNLGLSALAFNQTATHLTQNQVAQDAQLSINGLAVNSSTNTITDALKGVTLNLQQAQVGKFVSLDVSYADTDVKTAVSTFVDKFNELARNVSAAATYDPQTRTAGILLGESTVINTMSRLRAELGKTVTGLTGTTRSLADIGITTQKDGTLSFDSAKLSKAYATDRTAVAALFAVTGRPSDSSNLYVSSTRDTLAGQYGVEVTQSASQGLLSGSSVVGGVFPLAVNEPNNSLKIKVNGVQSGSITLTPTSYASGSELAAELQTRINGDSTLRLSGTAVKVSFSNDQFQIQSNLYGASSQVEITEINAQLSASLGLATGGGVAGHNVTGTINGEVAEGDGQVLTAINGSAKGVSLLMEGSRTGTRGTVDFTRGIMEQINSVLSAALDNNGMLAVRTKGLSTSITDITRQRTDLSTRMETYQRQLYTRFNAMDSMMGKLQATSTYLTQQITALNAANKQN
jgi:flagellar hook-associated protein 2